jgi:uncharacterized repeat protein (TIGR02543 family)
MKTKNCGVYAALAAVLLVSAILVTNCVDPLGIGGVADTGSWQSSLPAAPPGKAYLRVILPDAGAGRTILPENPGTILSYKVSILGKNSEGSFGATAKDGAVDFGSSSEIFVVNEGYYTVTVAGYTSSNVSGDPVAMGQDLGPTSAGVHVTQALGGSASVTLTKIIDDDVDGSLYYNFMLPTGLDTASLSVITYSGGTAAITPVNLILTAGSNVGTIAVPSGYHWVNVALTKAKHESVTYSQILHIYGGQTSRWGLVGTPANLVINKNRWDVTLNANTGIAGSLGTDWDNGTAGWPNGGTVTTPTTNYIPTKSGATFDGWYTQAGTGGVATGTKWVFTGDTNPNLIYRDIILYANWATVQTGDLAITITPYTHDAQEGTFDFGTSVASVAYAPPPGGPNISVTVALDDGDDPANDYFDAVVGWMFSDRTPITIASDTNNNVLTTAKILAAKPTFVFMSNGEYEFIFVGKIGGVDYNGSFTITVGTAP